MDDVDEIATLLIFLFDFTRYDYSSVSILQTASHIAYVLFL